MLNPTSIAAQSLAFTPLAHFRISDLTIRAARVRVSSSVPPTQATTNNQQTAAYDNAYSILLCYPQSVRGLAAEGHLAFTSLGGLGAIPRLDLSNLV